VKEHIAPQTFSYKFKVKPRGKRGKERLKRGEKRERGKGKRDAS